MPTTSKWKSRIPLTHQSQRKESTKKRSRKYDPEQGGAENFPTTSDLKSDTTKQDTAAGDRLAKERHENLKQRGYTGWAYDPQSVQAYEEQERAHKGSSGV